MNLKKNSKTFVTTSQQKKNIVAPLSFSNFPVKLIFWGNICIFCLDKSIPMSL